MNILFNKHQQVFVEQVLPITQTDLCVLILSAQTDKNISQTLDSTIFNSPGSLILDFEKFP